MFRLNEYESTALFEGIIFEYKELMYLLAVIVLTFSLGGFGQFRFVGEVSVSIVHWGLLHDVIRIVDSGSN